MAKTFMGYPFDEELFYMQWQSAQDPVKLAMLNSGAVASDATIQSLISNGSNLYTLPFYNTIGGTPDNYDGNTDIKTDTATGDYTSGVVFGRAHGWYEHDFQRDFGNNLDPMKQISSQVAKYWDKQRQKIMLGILDGAVNWSGADSYSYKDKWKSHIHNIARQTAGTAEDANKLGETTLGDAMQEACGDNADIFSMCWMHSRVAQNLANLQLLKFRTYTDPMGIERQLKIADYNGITVIVDDDCPHSINQTSKLMEYHTYVIGSGFMRHATAPVDVPVETWREPKEKGGRNELITRLRESYHPTGFSFLLPSNCLSPTNEQLFAKANWQLKTDPKLVPLIDIVSNG